MILDTNAISAFFEDVPAVCMTLGGCEVLAAPSIVLGEYRFGLSKETNRKVGMWRLSESLGPDRAVEANCGLPGRAGISMIALPP